MWSNFIPLLQSEAENEDTTVNQLPPAKLSFIIFSSLYK